MDSILMIATIISRMNALLVTFGILFHYVSFQSTQIIIFFQLCCCFCCCSVQVYFTLSPTTKLEIVLIFLLSNDDRLLKTFNSQIMNPFGFDFLVWNCDLVTELDIFNAQGNLTAWFTYGFVINQLDKIVPIFSEICNLNETLERLGVKPDKLQNRIYVIK